MNPVIVGILLSLFPLEILAFSLLHASFKYGDPNDHWVVAPFTPPPPHSAPTPTP